MFGAVQGQGIGPELLDPLIAGSGWIIGLMLVGVALSALGYAWWWAGTMDAPTLGRAIARAALGGLGIGFLLAGGWALAIGTEAAAGYPLGRSSGGTVLVAYWIALMATNRELALSAGLLRRAGRGWLAGATALLGVGAWALTKLMAFFVLMVAFAQLLE